MPAKSRETQLAKIGRDHQKARELLEREAQRADEQGEAARQAAGQARAKIAELEATRPGLAAEVFAGSAEYSDLDELDSELDQLRRSLEVAQLAAEQAGERAPAIAARMQEAEREAAAKRYDVLAGERKERSTALDDTLDALDKTLDALLELDRRQREEESTLDMSPDAVPYIEQLRTHLKIRLQRHIPEAGSSIGNVDMLQQRSRLAEKDWRTRSLSEVRGENEAEADELNRQNEERKAADQVRARRQRYETRKAELLARYGASQPGVSGIPGGQARSVKVEAIVSDALRHEYPDLFEEDQTPLVEVKHQRPHQLAAPQRD